MFVGNNAEAASRRCVDTLPSGEVEARVLGCLQYYGVPYITWQEIFETEDIDEVCSSMLHEIIEMTMDKLYIWYTKHQTIPFSAQYIHRVWKKLFGWLHLVRDPGQCTEVWGVDDIPQRLALDGWAANSLADVIFEHDLTHKVMVEKPNMDHETLELHLVRDSGQCTEVWELDSTSQRLALDLSAANSHSDVTYEHNLNPEVTVEKQNMDHETLESAEPIQVSRGKERFRANTIHELTNQCLCSPCSDLSQTHFGNDPSVSQDSSLSLSSNPFITSICSMMHETTYSDTQEDEDENGLQARQSLKRCSMMHETTYSDTQEDEDENGLQGSQSLKSCSMKHGMPCSDTQEEDDENGFRRCQSLKSCSMKHGMPCSDTQEEDDENGFQRCQSLKSCSMKHGMPCSDTQEEDDKNGFQRCQSLIDGETVIYIRRSRIQSQPILPQLFECGCRSLTRRPSTR